MQKLAIETAGNKYSHVPKSVCEYKDITVIWNEGLHTGSGQ